VGFKTCCGSPSLCLRTRPDDSVCARMHPASMASAWLRDQRPHLTAATTARAQIRLGMRYLRDVLKLRFPELRARAAAAAPAAEEREARCPRGAFGSGPLHWGHLQGEAPARTALLSSAGTPPVRRRVSLSAHAASCLEQFCAQLGASPGLFDSSPSPRARAAARAGARAAEVRAHRGRLCDRRRRHLLGARRDCARPAGGAAHATRDIAKYVACMKVA